MKRGWILALVLLSVVVLAGCRGKEELHVLNWGEYMDEDLIAAFEEAYGVRVVYETVGSNEMMETKLKTSGVPYDIMIPSDYMIDKLSQEGLLLEIDTDLLPNLENVTFFEDALALYENEPFGAYMIPYFFGTVGIIFNTNVEGIATTLEEEGICALFNPQTPYRIGMYDSPRDAVGAALLCLEYSVNTVDAGELAEAETLLSEAAFAEFGEDNLKLEVALGNLDMALVYSGDYFDMLFIYEEEGEDITFDFYTPLHTNIWIDAFVIPTTSKNPEMAHAFINFFLDIDTAAENADYVGYTPVIVEVYDIMLEEYEYDYDHYYPQPEGHTREVYRFISNEHSNTLFEILSRIRD